MDRVKFDLLVHHLNVQVEFVHGLGNALQLSHCVVDESSALRPSQGGQLLFNMGSVDFDLGCVALIFIVSWIKENNLTELAL